MTETHIKHFKTAGFLTISAVLILIQIGGIVRITGAGMGCPDWPKCFDQWVPPTDVSELPVDYQERYADRGYGSTEFNATKTWTEYINRLFGAMTGVFVVGMALFAYRIRKAYPHTFRATLGAVFLIGFQGWLGSKVVEFNLRDEMITVHLFVAILILAVLLYGFMRVFKTTPLQNVSAARRRRLSLLAVVTLVLTIGQIYLGSLVRDNIDEISKHWTREFWVDNADAIFYIHRSFSIVLTALVGLLVYKTSKQFASVRPVFAGSNLVALGAGMQIVSGIVLTYYGFPRFGQAMHMFFFPLMLTGLIVIISYLSNYKEETQPAEREQVLELT